VERLRLVEALEHAEQRATDAEHAERVAAHAEADAERRARELTKERDEARAIAERLRQTVRKLESEPSPRDIAERQREACAARVRHLDADPDVGYTSAEILATPLVTDGGGE
jgi:hypothetical protein